MKHRQIKGKRPRGKTGLVRMKERGVRKIKKNKERQGRDKDRDKGQTGGLSLQSLYDVMLEEVSYKTQLRPLSVTHTHSVFKGAPHSWLHSAVPHLCPHTPLHSHHCYKCYSFTLKTSLAVLHLVILHMKTLDMFD